jgi:hypothetical protein
VVRCRRGGVIPRAVASVPAVLLGDDLLEWILLAVGGALLVGNLLALVRPPASRKEGDLERPPLARSLAYAGIGALAAIWALASLLSG